MLLKRNFDYDFVVDPSTPDGHTISFALDPINATNGGPWTDTIDIPVVCDLSDTPIFEEYFDTDQGWTNDTAGYFYRDTTNEWLDWEARRDTDQRYYIEIPAIESDQVRFRFRMNIDGFANNDDINVGLVETLDGSYNGQGSPTGFFARIGYLGGGTSDVELFMSPFVRYTDGDAWQALCVAQPTRHLYPLWL